MDSQNVASVTQIHKKTQVGANTMDHGGSSVKSALDGVQRNLEAGKMAEAKRSFSRATQALAKSGGGDGASRKAMANLGAAFRADDSKAAKKGVEAAQKAISSSIQNSRSAEKSVTHFKQTYTESQNGIDIGGTSTKRMFNAIA